MNDQNNISNNNDHNKVNNTNSNQRRVSIEGKKRISSLFGNKRKSSLVQTPTENTAKSILKSSKKSSESNGRARSKSVSPKINDEYHLVVLDDEDSDNTGIPNPGNATDRSSGQNTPTDRNRLSIYGEGHDPNSDYTLGKRGSILSQRSNDSLGDHIKAHEVQTLDMKSKQLKKRTKMNTRINQRRNSAIGDLLLGLGGFQILFLSLFYLSSYHDVSTKIHVVRTTTKKPTRLIIYLVNNLVNKAI